MINVLSLFDGMSCGQIALDQLGIKVGKYYASEIDKYAIAVTKKNYPNTIHLGDVTKVDGTKLDKIDFLIGGSPCQGFSFAGKQLNFDDPRSSLFFEYVRLLKETKPKYFMLENVRMKQEYQDVISNYLGVKPIMINSSLVSAQNRVRLYWTNIPNVTQPQDMGIVLKDILEDGVVDRDKSHCLDANYFKGGNLKSYFEKHRRQLVFSKDILEDGVVDRELIEFKINEDILDNYVPDKNADFCDPYNKRTLNGDKSTTLRLNSSNGNTWVNSKQSVGWRKLTPLECERLQTVPDGYTEGVSNSQRYKMLGNGWTVEVIKHIFKNIK